MCPPIQVDHGRPVRTVDTTGQTIETHTNGAAPIKHVDSIGRERDVTREANGVAKAAAADNPEVAKTEGEAAESKDGAKEPTQAEIRKAWLRSQQVLRGANEKEKKAAAALARADAFEKVRSLAESGEDPVALLKAAGLDEVKYYQHLTKYALSDKARAPEDPVQKELRDHRERLDKYAKDLEVQATTIREREEMAAHNQVIADKVIPLLRDNADKYEALITEYGANAAVEVYKTVWDIYKETGKARSFAEVADEMETYWTETIGKGLEAAAKLKKFQNRFAQSAPETPANPPTAPATPMRSVTLSNKPPALAAAPPAPAPRRHLTRDERVAEILRKFPG